MQRPKNGKKKQFLHVQYPHNWFHVKTLLLFALEMGKNRNREILKNWNLGLFWPKLKIDFIFFSFSEMPMGKNTLVTNSWKGRLSWKLMSEFVKPKVKNLFVTLQLLMRLPRKKWKRKNDEFKNSFDGSNEIKRKKGSKTKKRLQRLQNW